jgi:hypothetical protein
MAPSNEAGAINVRLHPSFTNTHQRVVLLEVHHIESRSIQDDPPRSVTTHGCVFRFASVAELESFKSQVALLTWPR